MSSTRSRSRERETDFVDDVERMFDEVDEEDEFEDMSSYSRKSEIKAFAELKENKVYEILYITKDFPSLRYKDQDDRVVVLRENIGENEPEMYFAPCSLGYKKVFNFILGNGAYIKSKGKKKSKKSDNWYFDVDLRSPPKPKHDPPTKDELIEHAKKVQEQIDAEKAQLKKSQEYDDYIDEINACATKMKNPKKKRSHQKIQPSNLCLKQN